MTRATGAGKLARFAHRDEPCIQPIGQRRPKDESARLDPQHQVDIALDVVGGQRVDQLGEAGLVFQQRGDVVKQNPRLGKIRHRAHQRLQVLPHQWA